MRLKLEQRWVDWLVTLPESGMGYQRVNVRMSDGRELEDTVVLNAEWLELPDDFAGASVVDIELYEGGRDADVT